MPSKAVTKTAHQLLDRFFRDAEGRTNRQLDVYFTLEDLRIAREKADPALEFLVSRGLINQFGPDIAFLTDKGAQAIIEDDDISKMAKELRDFVQKPIPEEQPQPEPVAAEPEPEPVDQRPSCAMITHFDTDGNEYTMELAWVCSVGRSEGNDIRVNDQRASKRHAEFRYDDGQYVLCDLGSANGTLLNGEYVKQQVLKHDDEVIIGRTAIIFGSPEGYLPEPQGEVPGSEETLPPQPAQAPEPPPPAVVEPEPEVPVEPDPPQQPHMPTPDQVPQAITEPPAEEAIRVVKGARVPQAPSTDLFSEEPAVADSGEDLFAEPEPDMGEDLFAEPAHAKEEDQLIANEPSSDPDDLFADGPQVQVDEDDLFAPEPTPTPAMEDYPPQQPPPMDDVLEELHPIEEEIPQAIIEQPTEADVGAYEEAQPQVEGEQWHDEGAPEQNLWEEDTPGAEPILENQPVVAEDEHQPPTEEELATVMMARDAYGDTAEAEAETPRPTSFDSPEPSPDEVSTGDLAPPEEAIPFQENTPVSPGVIEGESLPVAEAQMAMDEPTETEFFALLASIRRQAERADLPDRDRLIGALDFIQHHPYVRVALEMLGKE